MHNQLIVRTTPENLEQIKRIIRRLDVAPRQLLITVRQGAVAKASGSSAAISGRLRWGDRSRLSLPDRGADGLSIEQRSRSGAIRGRVQAFHAHSDDESVQQVRVLEGHEALIQIGQAIPMTDYFAFLGPDTAQVRTEYLDVTRGFAVVARLSGDRVTLHISPWRERLTTMGGTGEFEVQRLHTTVTGRLDEWMDIGGAIQGLVTREAGTAYRITIQAEDRRQVLLKVEEVP
jgi:hypothetical protein